MPKKCKEAKRKKTKRAVKRKPPPAVPRTITRRTTSHRAVLGLDELPKVFDLMSDRVFDRDCVMLVIDSLVMSDLISEPVSIAQLDSVLNSIRERYRAQLKIAKRGSR